MPEERSGILVVRIDPLSDAARVLQPHDVVMEVSGCSVADDGTAAFRDDERLEYTHLIRRWVGGVGKVWGVWEVREAFSAF
eukprot:195605-Chlamydomonas_euryale.AAC.1